MALAVAVDFDLDPCGQRIHDRNADAVQAARHLVTAVAELSAGMKNGENDLGRGQILVLRVDSDRNTTAVVDHFDPAVGPDLDIDAVAMPSHRLIHSVVHNLPHEVVEAGGTCGPDVHPRTFANRFQAFENLDVCGAVRVA